jgi:hypothetical protein
VDQSAETAAEGSRGTYKRVGVHSITVLKTRGNLCVAPANAYMHTWDTPIEKMMPHCREGGSGHGLMWCEKSCSVAVRHAALCRLCDGVRCRIMVMVVLISVLLCDLLCGGQSSMLCCVGVFQIACCAMLC